MVRFFSFLCLPILSMSLFSCGESGSSGDVGFEILPKNPVVIDAPITLNPGTDNETKVEKAFFNWDFRVVNNSTRDLVIATLKFDITAQTRGGPTTVESEVDPGDADLVVLAQVPANGGEFQFSVDEGATWFSGGLPGEEDGVTSFIFTVNVDIVGYFTNDDGKAAERLNKTYFFTTQ